MVSIAVIQYKRAYSTIINHRIKVWTVLIISFSLNICNTCVLQKLNSNILNIQWIYEPDNKDESLAFIFRKIYWILNGNVSHFRNGAMVKLPVLNDNLLQKLYFVTWYFSVGLDSARKLVRHANLHSQHQHDRLNSERCVLNNEVLSAIFYSECSKITLFRREKNSAIIMHQNAW